MTYVVFAESEDNSWDCIRLEVADKYSNYDVFIKYQQPDKNTSKLSLIVSSPNLNTSYTWNGIGGMAPLKFLKQLDSEYVLDKLFVHSHYVLDVDNVRKGMLSKASEFLEDDLDIHDSAKSDIISGLQNLHIPEDINDLYATISMDERFDGIFTAEDFMELSRIVKLTDRVESFIKNVWPEIIRRVGN